MVRSYRTILIRQHIFFHFWFLQEIKEALLRKRKELKMTIMSLEFSLAVNEEVNVAEF